MTAAARRATRSRRRVRCEADRAARCRAAAGRGRTGAGCPAAHGAGRSQPAAAEHRGLGPHPALSGAVSRPCEQPCGGVAGAGVACAPGAGGGRPAPPAHQRGAPHTAAFGAARRGPVGPPLCGNAVGAAGRGILQAVRPSERCRPARRGPVAARAHRPLLDRPHTRRDRLAHAGAGGAGAGAGRAGGQRGADAARGQGDGRLQGAHPLGAGRTVLARGLPCGGGGDLRAGLPRAPAEPGQ